MKRSTILGAMLLTGSLEANTVNGKLYGLPVTTDFWVLGRWARARPLTTPTKISASR